MKTVLMILVVIFLASCAAGPVMVAKNEAEGIRKVYTDPELSRLDQKYHALLRDLYARFTQGNVDIYPDGIGFVALRDKAGRRHHYLQVQVRPRDVGFDGNTTKARQRFSTIIQRSFPVQMRYIKREDVDNSDISGLALAVFWPVRDYSQCNKNGGFIEYAQVYMQKGDVLDILNGLVTFLEVAQESEVIASLDLAPATSIRIVEK